MQEEVVGQPGQNPLPDNTEMQAAKEERDRLKKAAEAAGGSAALQRVLDTSQQTFEQKLKDFHGKDMDQPHRKSRMQEYNELTNLAKGDPSHQQQLKEKQDLWEQRTKHDAPTAVGKPKETMAHSAQAKQTLKEYRADLPPASKLESAKEAEFVLIMKNKKLSNAERKEQMEAFHAKMTPEEQKEFHEGMNSKIEAQREENQSGQGKKDKKKKAYDRVKESLEGNEMGEAILLLLMLIDEGGDKVEKVLEKIELARLEKMAETGDAPDEELTDEEISSVTQQVAEDAPYEAVAEKIQAYAHSEEGKKALGDGAEAMQNVTAEHVKASDSERTIARDLSSGQHTTKESLSSAVSEKAAGFISSQGTSTTKEAVEAVKTKPKKAPTTKAAPKRAGNTTAGKEEKTSTDGDESIISLVIQLAAGTGIQNVKDTLAKITQKCLGAVKTTTAGAPTPPQTGGQQQPPATLHRVGGASLDPHQSQTLVDQKTGRVLGHTIPQPRPGVAPPLHITPSAKQGTKRKREDNAGAPVAKKGPAEKDKASSYEEVATAVRVYASSDQGKRALGETRATAMQNITAGDIRDFDGNHRNGMKGAVAKEISDSNSLGKGLASVASNAAKFLNSRDKSGSGRSTSASAVEAEVQRAIASSSDTGGQRVPPADPKTSFASMRAAEIYDKPIQVETGQSPAVKV
jgi:hypothetical protein